MQKNRGHRKRWPLFLSNVSAIGRKKTAFRRSDCLMLLKVLLHATQNLLMGQCLSGLHFGVLGNFLAKGV